jgi:hypothetical protein
LGHGGPDIFLAVAPWCFLPYVVLIGGYVGFFSAKLARSNVRNPWLWAGVGFVLTIAFTIGFPIAIGLSGLFPYTK